MMHRLAIAVLACGTPGLASANASISAPQALCRAALAGAEHSQALPEKLLRAIGRVESGRHDPATQAFGAWPWTVNAEGTGYFYETKTDAIAAVRAFQAQGMRSIDVGCAQVNLMHHPDAFATLEIAFDPAANAAYAATFLRSLYQQTGAWPKAVAAYHSMTPELGEPYRDKVYAALADDDGAALPLPLALPAPLSAFGQAYPPGRLAVTIPPLGGGDIRVMPLAQAGTAPAAAPIGRGLESYRAMPIRLARTF